MSELNTIKNQIVRILKKYPVTKAAIFGSFAKGKENKHSDIDILIEPGKSVSLFLILKMEKELQQVTKRKVDIVEYTAIKTSIRKNILSEAISIL